MSNGSQPTGGIPGLGNSKPPTFTYTDDPHWGGADYTGQVASWGYLRLYPWQAWNEFNYNDTLAATNYYTDFLGSFMASGAFIQYSNQAILSMQNSVHFLEGTFSNQNDLISSDISGVTLAAPAFGQDLIALGRAIDLSTIPSFGLPSNLLATLKKNNALTPSLTLALLASGLSPNDVTTVINNVNVSTLQQQQTYAAFLIITGVDLQSICISLNCKTQGLDSLADLLNVKKLFPNSYQSLTVPIYNANPGPTNSKTYYPIFNGDSINPTLLSETINRLVGSIIPPGSPTTAPAPGASTTQPSSNTTLPPTSTPLGDAYGVTSSSRLSILNNAALNSTTIETAQPNNPTTVSQLNIQALPTGFGSYLQNILPPDIATAAGAFSRTMQQIRNIQGVPIEKFAQVAGTMETNKGLPLTNGTNVPTNIFESQTGAGIVALGSGPYNTYTYSDFFGCMSCLPYPWATIQQQIQTLTTTKLLHIYNQLFLAVTWQLGEVNITQNKYNILVQPYIPPDPLAVPPIAGQPRIDNWYYTVSSSLISSGGGYGRGTAPPPNVTFTPNHCSASATTTINGTDDTDARSNGGGTFGRITGYTFNPGSPYLYTTTSVYQAGPPAAPTPPTEYVTVQGPPTATLAVQDNGAIATGGTNTAGVTDNSTGGRTVLDAGWPGMNTPVQLYINQANDEIYVIRNNNLPLANALNLNWNNIGERLTHEQRARNIGLGSSPPPNTPPGSPIANINPYPITMYSFTDSIPSYAQNTDPHMSAQTIEAITDQDIVTGQSAVGLMRESRNQARLLKAGLILDNTISDVLPQQQQKQLLANGSLSLATSNGTANISTPPAYPDPSVTPTGYYDPVTQNYYTSPTTGPGGVLNTSPTNTSTGVGTPLDTGGPAVPGSLGGSPYQNLIQPSLNPYYTSGILLPATNSVSQAIEQVVACNCDCWVH